MARGVRIGSGHQVDVGGIVGRGGVHLLAVDDVLVAVAHGPALQARQVGAGLGFREAQGENDLTIDQPGNELLLLFLCPGGQNGRCAAAGPAHCDAGASELLFHDVLFNSATALAAVFLGPADSYPLAFSDLSNQFSVVLAAATLLSGLQFSQDVIGNVFRDESLDFLAEGFLFRCVCKVHRGPFSNSLDGGGSARQMARRLAFGA